ncbi:MAG: hypothetical protein R2873_08825 [Caldilineaceae bacterium]
MRNATRWPLRLLYTPVLILLLATISTSMASAHQPIFEEEDLSAERTLSIANPTISTALYATLDAEDDVDFFTFTAAEGTRVLIGMTIPQIAGQDEFAPTIALIGPGLPQKEKALLPPSAQSLINADNGFDLFLAPTQASAFFEPFSRTSYWRRQQTRVTMPADGTYTLIVWDAPAQMGRYVLVVGDREVPGGDPLFAIKLPNYWTPVDADAGASDASQLSTCTVLQELRHRILGGDLPCRPRRMP